MNNKGENFAQVLDRVLHGRGQGALIELAEQLGRDGDLNASQIHGSLKEWRSPSNLRAGLTFDLALRVAVSVPELLRGMAREAGFVLVPEGMVSGVSREGAVGIAAASIRESGETVSTFLDAVADGVVSEEELASLEAEAREDAELRAAMLVVARGLARRGRSKDCSSESRSERGGRPRHAGDESSGQRAALGKDQGVTDRRDGQACGAAALQAPATGDARPGVGGSTPPRSTNDGTNRTKGTNGAAARSARGRKGGNG